MKKNSIFSCMAAAMLCVAPMMHAQTLGTAQGTAIMYVGGAGLPTEPLTSTEQTINYQIVDDGTHIWAFYEASGNIYNAPWAAQLRNWGTDGNRSREMNLLIRPTATTAYNNTATDYTSDINYYALARDESGVHTGNSAQLQIYACFNGDVYACSQLFTYNVGSINNPTSDTQAPTLTNVTYQFNAAGDSIQLNMTGGSDNSGHFFYYISDATNGVSYVSFTNQITFAVRGATTYNLSVKTVDFDGNASTAIVKQVVTARPPFDDTINLALNKTVNAGGGNASQANDGNDGNGWQASDLADEWWTVDLGTAYDLREVQIRWETAYAKSYELYTSANGDTWTLQRTVSRSLAEPNNYEEVIPFVISNVRYIKYVTVERSMPYGANIREFRAYGINYYSDEATPTLTSIRFYNMPTSLIPSKPVSVSALALDQNGCLFHGASMTLAPDHTGIDISAGDTLYNSIFLLNGINGGNYVLTATAKQGSTTITKTANVSVVEAPRVATINISVNDAEMLNDAEAVNAFPTNYALPLRVQCIDQFGNAIATPELTWNTENGNMVGTTYTTNTVGTGKVSATYQTVTSNELTFNIVTNSENLALGKTVTAIETSNNAENAVDNNFGSVWEQPNVSDANNVYDAWLSVDLGAKYNIALVEVVWEGASAKNFTVDYATDGANYTTQYTVTNNPNMRTVYNRLNGTPSEAQQVRVFCTEAGTGYGVKIRELRVYGSPAGTNTGIISTLTSKDFAYAQMQAITFSMAGQARIYSATGTLVCNQKVTEQQTLSMPMGLYMVCLQADGQTYTQKVLVK